MSAVQGPPMVLDRGFRFVISDVYLRTSLRTAMDLTDKTIKCRFGTVAQPRLIEATMSVLVPLEGGPISGEFSSTETALAAGYGYAYVFFAVEDELPLLYGSGEVRDHPREAAP